MGDHRSIKPAVAFHDSDATTDAGDPRPDAGGAWSVVDYLEIIWQRRLIVAATFVLAVVMAGVYCLTATPMYEARAQLLIEPEAPRVVEFKEVIQEESGKTDYYQTQLQILQSRALARTTLETLQLWEHPEFKASPDRFALVRPFTGSAAATPQLDSGAPGAASTDTVERLQAIGRFLQRLTVEPVRNSRLVNVRFQSSDPQLSARVVNSLVRAYIERSTEVKRVASQEAVAWLDGQARQQRDAVERQEVRLQQFRDRNDVLSLQGQQSVVTQRLSDLNAAATRAKADRIAREVAYQQLQVASPDADSPPPGMSTPAIEALRTEVWTRQRTRAELATELQERHPDLIAATSAVREAERQLEAEIAKQRAVAAQDVLAARETELRLTAAFEAQKAETLALDRKAIEYTALQRETESNRQVLEALLQREKEMAVAGNLQTSNIRVVDAASVPLSSVYPRRQVTLGVGAFSGLALGLVVALLFGYMDTRIKSAEDIGRLLDLPFLGFAPAVPSKIVQHGHLLLNQGLSPEYGEALRVVRTNVVRDGEGGGPRILLITSAGRGEGKSLLAMNLAMILAQARQRVLLVDGDMRQPRLHDAFQQSRAPGLSDCLTDPTAAPTAVRNTDVQGLALMPAGTQVLSPADLLGFDPVAQVASIARGKFDWVVIDSPPVGIVTDACLFAGGNAKVVFVIAADRVKRSDAQAAVARLAAANASFAGAVLTGVHLKSSQYLSYS